MMDNMHRPSIKKHVVAFGFDCAARDDAMWMRCGDGTNQTFIWYFITLAVFCGFIEGGDHCISRRTSSEFYPDFIRCT